MPTLAKKKRARSSAVAGLPPLPRGAVDRRPILALSIVQKVLSRAMARGADFAEVYVERSISTSVHLEEGYIKSAQVGSVAGVGVRAASGLQVGYAYSDDLDEAALLRAADTAALIATGSKPAKPVPVMQRVPAPEHFFAPELMANVDVARKVDLVVRADQAARAFDKRVKQVVAVFGDQSKQINVANTLGELSEDSQEMCRMSVMVVAEAKGDRRTGFWGGGGRSGIGLYDTFTPESIGQEAARQAVATLGALDAPAGQQTVVLAPGWSGILLHEAIGHGLESDFIRKGTSLYAGKLGQRVASDKVTVIDDGTVAGARGSVNVDDEGRPAKRKILIERGVLREYMSDRLNTAGGPMKGASSGSGRRQSFRHPPMPRMTNTFLAPGDDDPQDIVRSVKRGIYARHFGGGQVDITNGNFVFEVNEAYLIEDGHITRPVKGATLIGIGPEVLKNVSMVGWDAQHDPGLGVCGKNGQSVPVGVGLPTVRIDNLTVGGTRV